VHCTNITPTFEFWQISPKFDEFFKILQIDHLQLFFEPDEFSNPAHLYTTHSFLLHTGPNTLGVQAEEIVFCEGSYSSKQYTLSLNTVH
jgi:hypothetical protein